MIPAVHAWPTNAHLIADVAKLGYLEGSVLDLTPGKGVWWKHWQPVDLTLNKDDFRKTLYLDASFDAVAYDPPYKLNGTPDPKVDARYGVHVPATWQERMALMREGLTEASRVSRRFVLAKCQDQVSSGKIRWQTLDLIEHGAWVCGLELVDRFDMIGTTRSQPMDGRRQRHAHGRPSTLLVFAVCESSPKGSG